MGLAKQDANYFENSEPCKRRKRVRSFSFIRPKGLEIHGINNTINARIYQLTYIVHIHISFTYLEKERGVAQRTIWGGVARQGRRAVELCYGVHRSFLCPLK